MIDVEEMVNTIAKKLREQEGGTGEEWRCKCGFNNTTWNQVCGGTWGTGLQDK